MSSLKRQLSQRLMIILCLLVGVGLVSLDTGIRQLIREFVDGRLQHDADNLISVIEVADARLLLPESRQPAVYQRAWSGHYFMIVTHGQTLRSRSLWDLTIEVPTLPAGSRRSGRLLYDPNGDPATTIPEGQSWRWYATAVTIEDIDATVWVAEDIEPLRQAVHQLRYQALVFVLIAMIVLIGAQILILQRGFAKLNPVQQQLRQLRFGEPLQDQQAPEEIRPLLQEIHRLLQQLQQRVSRSRNALGNLAHELKRPLQQLNLLATRLPEAAALEQQQALATLQRMVERELKRARIVGVSSPGRHTRLQDELPSLVRVFQKIYPDCCIQSEYPQDAILPQDRDDILELLGNLLDNGCQHGGKQLLFHCHRSEAGWHLAIEDDGPGIDEHQRDFLLQRGNRLDEQGAHKSGGISGSGLGLAICQDIVSSYTGTLRLETSKTLGGLAVRLYLPDEADSVDQDTH